MISLNKKLGLVKEYRPEIDGLRAIAVMSVIFFHFDFTYFNGGFVGVDIFFVISGYLISSIIFKEIQQKSFSIWQFYLLRAKRLLPALFFLLCILIIFGFIFLDFLTFKSLGKEIIACVFYFSNFLYWKDIGYFDIASIQKPLIHTWTLSVEEQFYFLFPLFLLLLIKVKRVKINIVHILILILIFSFSLNLYFFSKFPSATFYLLPTRAWEFISGSLLVFVSNKRIGESFKKIFFTFGILLIIISVCFLSKINFPGLNALIPVSGAMLFLFFGYENNFFLVKLFKSVFLNKIGKISYSLYLWHWPILVLYNYIVMRKLIFLDYLVLFSLIFIFSYLSWKYVEQKFRYYNKISKLNIVLIFMFLSVLISSLGLLINRKNGIPYRSKYNQMLVKAFDDPFWERLSENEVEVSKQNHLLPIFLGNIIHKPNFILWGDSHARAIALGLDSFAKSNKISGYVFTYSSTPPITSVNNVKNSQFDMKLYNKKILDFIKKNESIDNIILCSRWSYYLKDIYDENEIVNSPIFAIDSFLNHRKNLSNKDIFLWGLKRTIQELIRLNKNIFIISPLPELSQDIRIIVGNLKTYNFFNLSPRRYFTNKMNYYKENEYFFDFLRIFEYNEKIHILNVQELFFNKEGYSAIPGNQLLYRDKNHLSKFGSIYVRNIFTPILKNK